MLEYIAILLRVINGNFPVYNQVYRATAESNL